MYCSVLQLRLWLIIVSGTTDRYEAVIDETLAPNSFFTTILATDSDNKVNI